MIRQEIGVKAKLTDRYTLPVVGGVLQLAEPVIY